MCARTPFLLSLCAILIPSGPGGASDLLDFSGATIVAPREATSLETKAVQVLREQIKERTGLDLDLSNRWPGGSGPIIVVGARDGLPALHSSLEFLRGVPGPGAEGYTVVIRDETPPVAVVAGEDPRGVLYGVGHLLRKAVWSPGQLLIPPSPSISTAPRYPVRGHQLGNRNVNNTYDAWVPEQFDAYIRDLALFGANSIELIPPLVADYPTDHSQRLVPADEMMLHIVDSTDAYGMDVWVFYPSIEEGADEWDDPGDEAYSDPAFIRKEQERADRFFGGLKRLDALFVPGGDPGVLSPEALFSWLEKLAPVLAKHHPAAKIWVSDQFGVAGRSWYDTFIELANRTPAWLGGVAVGPGGGTPIPEMRQRLDPSLPIRHYVDITHIVPAQYPIPDYDRAFFLTLGREPPIPRPRAFKHIHNLYAEHTVGAIAYSEGVNDDVNKFVWLDQGWDPDTPVIETLRDYARVFIDPERTEALVQGFLALEENLNGVLAENPQIETTLLQWRSLEAEATPEVLTNWRFQLGLIRAYYDALVKMRLVQDRHQECRARAALARAPEIGASTAIDRAVGLLKRPGLEAVGQKHEARCRELADRLREGIGIQMSVERHGAVREDRGAIIDGIDYPLNDAPWLLDQMERARRLEDETQRLEAVETILNRTNPGPGGFYDDFGSEASLRRVVAPGPDWELDPDTYRSVFRRFEFGGQWLQKGPPIPLAWLSHLAVNFDQPLSVRYQDLDPEASYRIRVVHGRHPPSRLEADGHLVYDFDVTEEGPVLEHPVPVEATRDGEVAFTWTAHPENRRTAVAEVMLIREDAP